MDHAVSPKTLQEIILDKEPISLSLVLAVKLLNEKLVQKYIDGGADVMPELNGTRYSLLHFALRFKMINISEAFVRFGADHHYQDFNALRSIFKTKSSEIVEALIKAGADVNVQDVKGNTALHLAVERENNKCVKALTEADADVNLQNNEGCTALILASGLDITTLTETLIKAGAEINIRALEDGGTALHNACAARPLRNVELLLKAGADVNVIATNGWSALHFLFCGLPYCYIKNYDYNYLNENFYDTFNDYLKDLNQTVKLLIDAGIDVNQNGYGGTALHRAVTLPDNVKLVEELIRAGVDVNIQNGSGATALDVAYLSNDGRIVQILKEAGVDVNKQNKDGDTALHLASKTAANETVRALIIAGVDINRQNYIGDTSLHHNIKEFCDFEVLKILITNGACVNIKNKHGLDPLQCAKSSKSLVGVCKLHEHFQLYRDAYGNTIFHSLVNYCYHGDEVVNLIRARQFEFAKCLNFKNMLGRTPLHFAASKESHREETLDLIFSNFDKCELDLLVVDENGNAFFHTYLSLLLSPVRSSYNITFIKRLLGGEYINCSKTNIKKLVQLRNRTGHAPFHIFVNKMPDYHKGQDVQLVVEMFLKAGANINLCNNLGETVLHSLIYCRQQAATELAVENGAELNIQNIFGESPIFVVPSYYNIENWNSDYTKSMKLLVKYGVEMDVCNKIGQTPLIVHMTKVCANRDVISMFEKNVDINKQDFYGSNLLHYIAWTYWFELDYFVDIVDLLKWAGFRVLQDNLGLFPCDVAYLRGHKDILRGICICKNGVHKEKLVFCPAMILFESLKQKDDAFKNCVQTKRKYFSEASIRNIMNEPFVGIVKFEEDIEAKAIETEIMSIVKYICRRIEEKDELLANTVIMSGSVAENTKVGLPDEFDFLCVLKKMPELFDTEESADNSYVHLKLKEVHRGTARGRFFGPYPYFSISQRRLLDRFHDVLQEIMQLSAIYKHPNIFQVKQGIQKPYDTPNFALTLRWCCLKYKNMTVKIDLVPACQITCHPDSKFCSNTFYPDTNENEGLLILFQTVPVTDGSSSTSSFYEYKSKVRTSAVNAERKLLKALRQEGRDALGSMDLEIEKGRYTNTARENRKCKLCDTNSVEDECHFLLRCGCYRDLRELHIPSKYYTRPDVNKFNILMSTRNEELIKSTAAVLKMDRGVYPKLLQEIILDKLPMNISLVRAVESLNERLVQKYLDRGADVMPELNGIRLSLLHFALSFKMDNISKAFVRVGAAHQYQDFNAHYLVFQTKSSDIVEALIKAGADVNIQDEKGNTALHLAAEWGNSRCVKVLTEADADVNVQNNDGCTALHLASRSDITALTEALTETLIKAGAEINIRALDGTKALHHASNETVRELITAGVDINRQNYIGDTSLHRSIRSFCNFEVLEILITNYACVNIRNKYGLDPLQYAKHNDSLLGVCKLHGHFQLYRDAYGNTIFHFLVKYCDITEKVVNLIRTRRLSFAKYLNLKNMFGQTPLHTAASRERCSEETLDLILSNFDKCELDLLVVDENGNTFFHTYLSLFCSSNLGHDITFIKRFLKGEYINCSKENINKLMQLRNKTGHAPMHIFVNKTLDHHKVMDVRFVLEMFLKAGANINLCNSLGETVLHSLINCFCEQQAAIEFALENGADVNFQNIFGESPIFLFPSCYDFINWKSNYKRSIKLLVKYGVKMDVCNKIGQTPFFVYMMERSTDFCILISMFEKNVDINKQDIYGSHLLHYIAWKYSFETFDHHDPLDLWPGFRVLKDNLGLLPCDVAYLRGHKNVHGGICICKNGVHKEELVFCPAMLRFGSLKQKDDVFQSCIQTKRKYFSEASIRNIINEPFVGLVKFEGEAQAIKTAVVSIVKDICRRIGEKDELLTNTVIMSGSVAETTKVGLPDEFDFLCVLNKMPELFDIEESTDKSFVNLKLKEVHRGTARDRFFENYSDSPISQSLLIDRFHDVLQEIMQMSDIYRHPNIFHVKHGVQKPGGSPNFALTLRWSCSKYKDMTLKIDLVPACQITCPPDSKFYSNTFNPDTNEGLLIMFQNEFVTKGSSITSIEINEKVRTSAVNAERNDLNDLRQEGKDAYVISKILCCDRVCPSVIDVNHVCRKENPTCASIISSYMLKNCLFHVAKEESIETLSKLSVHGYVCKIFEKLIQCSLEGNLPCYMFPWQNIFTFQSQYNEHDIRITCMCRAMYAKIILSILGKNEDFNNISPQMINGSCIHDSAEIIKDDNICANCKKNPDKHGIILETCSRCKLWTYCSAKCREENRDRHKLACDYHYNNRCKPVSDQ
ncbi:uncharacterized protein LOC128549926 [Mercenaria mercenaria]|uniref:uncharacterized protein LOC128549926 n=1 Tax=Mercenaria mercenaria TaxID=6596 RepID=UPI00234E950B|nr:uncharacterized protein LOC128549926 [Mercenaria mercenaria]